MEPAIGWGSHSTRRGNLLNAAVTRLATDGAVMWIGLLLAVAGLLLLLFEVEALLEGRGHNGGAMHSSFGIGVMPSRWRMWGSIIGIL